MSHPTVRPLNIGSSDAPYLSGTARTTEQTGNFIETDGYRGVRVVVDITNVHAVSPGLTFTIQGYDPTSAKWFTLLASAALGAVATTDLVVYPGCVAVANRVANAPLPERIRVDIDVADTDACTYTVGVQLIP